MLNECSAFMNGFFDLIDGPWMNDRDFERKASSKIRQLQVASEVGFEIPRTVVTNEPNAVRSLLSAGGDVVFKPVAGYAPRGADFSKEVQARLGNAFSVEMEEHLGESDAEVVFAQLLTNDKLDALGALQLCPATFQRYVHKGSDIRVTIVGERLFACRIQSQAHEGTRVDFRRMTLLRCLKDVPHEAIALPSSVELRLRNLMQQLGLLFGCIDLVETQSGEFVFLEVNPSGQWLWIERMTGQPISLEVAQLLARLVRV